MSKRNQCELLGITERIYSLYHDDGMSLKAISELLNKEGCNVSKASIHRAIKAKDESKKELEIVAEKTRVVMETFKDTDIDTALDEMNSALHGKLLAAIASMEEIQETDPEKLLKMFELLNRANASALKLKMAYEKGFNEGYEEGRKNRERVIKTGLSE